MKINSKHTLPILLIISLVFGTFIVSFLKQKQASEKPLVAKLMGVWEETNGNVWEFQQTENGFKLIRKSTDEIEETIFDDPAEEDKAVVVSKESLSYRFNFDEMSEYNSIMVAIGVTTGDEGAWPPIYLTRINDQ